MAGSSHGHGHTPAAWTGVIISFIGFNVAGVFMVMNNPLGFWAGIGVTLLGAVVGGAMKAAGLGSKLQPVRVQGGTATAKPAPAEVTATA
ncbi:HGxxPAAW family protein [Streptomyces sp. SCSIO 30461]|uniref:HGxxPAAW family protein n=1 Tax=Streptomyces sp. SCSIO 30461 TaxID=3118085 RepID=UPI0030D4F8C9